MVGARLDRSRACTSVDYRSADDLLGSWLHLAEPPANCVRPIADDENGRVEPSEILTHSTILYKLFAFSILRSVSLSRYIIVWTLLQPRPSVEHNLSKLII